MRLLDDTATLIVREIEIIFEYITKNGATGPIFAAAAQLHASVGGAATHRESYG